MAVPLFCFATPLAREEFASELFNNQKNNSVHSFLKSLYL